MSALSSTGYAATATAGKPPVTRTINNPTSHPVFEIEGTVKKILAEQTFSSGFRKREFVITTREKYPQDIKFECVQEKIDQLSSLQEGQPVKVRFDLRGREWKDNYYVNLSAWKVEVADGSGPGVDDAPPDDVAQDTADYGDDDIPF